MVDPWSLAWRGLQIVEVNRKGNCPIWMDHIAMIEDPSVASCAMIWMKIGIPELCKRRILVFLLSAVSLDIDTQWYIS